MAKGNKNKNEIKIEGTLKDIENIVAMELAVEIFKYLNNKDD